LGEGRGKGQPKVLLIGIHPSTNEKGGCIGKTKDLYGPKKELLPQNLLIGRARQRNRDAFPEENFKKIRPLLGKSLFYIAETVW